MVQVTSPQKLIVDLEDWILFYRQKEIFVEVREQKMSNGATKYALWRGLTEHEQFQLDKGILEIQVDSLVFRHYKESTKRPGKGSYK
jgi:hypothetical protein